MSRCSVTDIFSEIIKISVKANKDEKVSDKIGIHRGDLENKFRLFLRILYESVTLERAKKFDISNMCKNNRRAYETFKRELAKLSSDISYNNFSAWINIKKITDFYKITETEIAEQDLQIMFYKECKKIMWKFLMATNCIKNIEYITKNSLNTDKIYEHIKHELRVHNSNSVTQLKPKITEWENNHETELKKLHKLQKTEDKEQEEGDGERVQIAKLYYLEKQILMSINEEEEKYDYYYDYFEKHSKMLRNNIIEQDKRSKVVRQEIVKRFIVEEEVEMEQHLDPYEQDLVIRCRREYSRRLDELLEILIKEKSEEINKENAK